MGFDHLVYRFREAGLKLELLAENKIGGRVNSEVFSLDIRRKTSGANRYEYFRIFPGNPDNVISVLNIDRRLCQLILLVQEPKRDFYTDIPRRQLDGAKIQAAKKGLDWMAWLAQERGVNPRNIVNVGGFLKVKSSTPSNKRHYLCGVDERQLFICQLPKGTSSVREAHAVLKRPNLILAEGKVGPADRQGEWFFLMPTKEELLGIQQAIKKDAVIVRKKVAIHALAGGNAGKPHMADEAIRVLGKLLEHGFAVRENEVFVRGKIRHPDHKTKSYSTWRKVIRNNEANSAGGGVMGANGIFWVD